jgi:hypothetical protein
VLTSRSPRGGAALRVRLGELQAWQWKQIDWEQGFVTLNAEETKSGYARVVPILAGDMRDWLKSAHVSQTNAGKCSTMMVSRSTLITLGPCSLTAFGQGGDRSSGKQKLCVFACPGKNESVGKPIKFRVLLPGTRLERAEVNYTGTSNIRCQTDPRRAPLRILLNDRVAFELPGEIVRIFGSIQGYEGYTEFTASHDCREALHFPSREPCSSSRPNKKKSNCQLEQDRHRAVALKGILQSLKCCRRCWSLPEKGKDRNRLTTFDSIREIGGLLLPVGFLRNGQGFASFLSRQGSRIIIQ